MGESAIAIEWASASVEDARVSVGLTGKPSDEWRESFERVLDQLDRRGSGWGEIELGKRKLHVAAVTPGAEADLRHLLESVVLQANAAVGADGGSREDEPDDGPDAGMTAAFRAFASDSTPMGTAIVDIDGTLVDTNYHHALAWYRAFRQHGLTLPLWRVHRHIGMGGDQLVGALAGDGFEREHGDAVRAAESVLYNELIGEVQPLTGARALLEDLKGSGHTVVLASSAKPDELAHYLQLLDARSLVDAWTDSGDVEQTKPEPDLVLAALAKSGAAAKDAVMIGDSTWDCRAAKAAKVRSLGVLTGGFSEGELADAGAAKVFDSVELLRAHLQDTPLRV